MPVLTFCTISVCVCVWCTYGPAGLFPVTVIALVFTLCSCVTRHVHSLAVLSVLYQNGFPFAAFVWSTVVFTLSFNKGNWLGLLSLRHSSALVFFIFSLNWFFRSVLVTRYIMLSTSTSFFYFPYWYLHFKLSESFFLWWSKIFSTVCSTKSLDATINCDEDNLCLFTFVFIWTCVFHAACLFSNGNHCFILSILLLFSILFL